MKKFWNNKGLVIALLIYHLFVAVVIWKNFPMGKWFLGWDSVSPELNFKLNFQRAIFSSWQENYGAGLIAGHGFASTLPHTIITYLLSFFVSTQIIRSVFTFLCWYIGGLGLFFLSSLSLSKISKGSLLSIYLASLLASFYYLVNLGTIQIFSIQLEAFIIHFAALPWLFWSLAKFILKPSRRNIVIFLLISFFASGQGFIPSLFVAYFIALIIFLFIYLLSQKFNKESLKRSFIAILLTFLVNSYWLFPVVYYTFNEGGDFSKSYNNLISTPDMIDKSQKYGTLDKTSLIKGFYLDAYELGGFVEEPWLSHHRNPLVPFVGYSFFALAVVGMIAGFFIFKSWLVRGLSFVFIYFIGSLSVATSPFSYFWDLLRIFIPTLAQAFRTTFTKLGLGTAFGMSLSISFGIFALFTCFAYLFPKRHLIATKIISILLLISLIFYSWPLFNGNFLFKKMLIDMPKPYMEIMNYFKDQSDGRIVDFPQNCPEGWYGYNWDYFGSGFLWYGIRQPVMSRTFDVWSENNENYYWEIKQALTNQNYEEVDRVLNKYSVRWILYDPNTIHCKDRKAIFRDQELIEFLDKNPDYELTKTFTDEKIKPIKIYERNDNSVSYISVHKNLLNIGPSYSFNDSDQAKSDYFYIAEPEKPYDTYFPFREFFTKRNVEEKNFDIAETDDKIIFSTNLPAGLNGYELVLPQIIDDSRSIPVEVKLVEVYQNKYLILATMQTPLIYLDDLLLNKPSKTYEIGSFSSNTANLQVYINDVLKNSADKKYQSIFSPNVENTILVLDEKNQTLFSWKDVNNLFYTDLSLETEKIHLPEYKHGLLKVEVSNNSNTDEFEQTIDAYKYVPVYCDESTSSNKAKFEVSENEAKQYLRMISEDEKECLTLSFKNISTNIGYLLKVETRNIDGQSLRVSVSSDGSSVGVGLFLQANEQMSGDFLILPPTFKSQIQYDLLFKNTSSSHLKTVNDIGKVEMKPIPYRYIKNMKLNSPDLMAKDSGEENSFSSLPSVKHPNETYFKVNIDEVDSGEARKLIMFQSFNPSWLAFADKESFPYVQLLSKHSKINNWANGWDLPSEVKTVHLFFWPQSFVSIGYGILLLLPIFLFKFRK